MVTKEPASDVSAAPTPVEREQGRLVEFARHLSDAAGNEAPGIDDFLYGPRKLSSHPSPVAPGMPPAVTMLPGEEIQALRQTIVRRYLKQIRLSRLARLGAGLRRAEIAAVSDGEYIAFLTMTACAKLMSPELTALDRQRFGIESDDAGRYYKYDFSRIGEVAPIDGVRLCANVALISRNQAGHFEPGAICLNDHVFRPGDGDAWELAKYFVISSGGNLALLSEHPMVHFPMDAVNAAAKSIFPADHRVLQLVLPHSYLQLPLNYAVLYQKRSVLQTGRREPYSLFPHRDVRDVYRLIAERYSGTSERQGAASRFRYPMRERVQLTDYDRFLNEYFRVILDFVSQALAGVSPADPYVRQWASVLSASIHGFPDEQAVARGSNLARALAGYIWNCSVVHSLDHYTLSRFPMEKMPLRMRVEPPGPEGCVLDRRKISSRSDIFSQRLGCRMYFRPHTITRLVDVDYRFETSGLRLLNQTFIDNLRQLDAALPCHRFMPVDEMAASIQY